MNQQEQLNQQEFGCSREFEKKEQQETERFEVSPPTGAPTRQTPDEEPGSSATSSPALEQSSVGPAIPSDSAEQIPATQSPIPVPESAPPAPVVPVAQWKYVAVPPDMPDYHEEHSSRFETTAEGWKIVGARVRGKKHKHEGTNCDDWFELAAVGPWILVAVSDGAGSKRFSRVGASTSCQAAIRSLKARLDFQLQPRRWLENSVFGRTDNGDFVQEDLQEVVNALHDAMQSAYQAVQRKARKRSNSVKHYEILGNRKVDVNDLAATLMLMVQTRVLDSDGTSYDLIMGCAVGDGMMATIDKIGTARLLLIPDSGQFSGETEFLSEKMMDPTQLKGRLQVVFGRPQQVLLAMTDGVADDYFPHDPGMSRLYGDLVLNGIIEIQGPSSDDRVAALQQTGLPTLEAVQQADFTVQGEMLTAAGTQPLKLNSVARYAEQLAIPLEQVLASPALLLAGRQSSPVLAEESVAKRLQLWLDSYQVRGSFDDRTLVVAYREKVV
ncbi:MAG: PP2C family serine/threonine-protein phosphatase [Candidatus Competibacteraceae bacterium]